MAQITNRYTMGWYGGCDCTDVQVRELGQNLLGKVKFVETTSEGGSYNTMPNTLPFPFAKLKCGKFYMVINETSPVEAFDIPNFHILSSSGKNLSKCCEVDIEISIENIDVLQQDVNNIVLDVSLENTSLWAYSINGGEKENVTGITQTTFTAPVGKHTLTVFATDDNGNYVDEETSFFEVVAPDKPVLPCCSEFLHTHTESTSEEELGENFDPSKLQTGKEYGYVELQKSKGPFSEIKPELNIAKMCHNGATASDPMPPMDLQSMQNFENDGFFNQSDFTFKHGEIAFGRQYQGKIQVTLVNDDCYEGCVCPDLSEVNLVPLGELGNCSCGG
jgi:hypothetical protein